MNKIKNVKRSKHLWLGQQEQCLHGHFRTWPDHSQAAGSKTVNSFEIFPLRRHNYQGTWLAHIHQGNYSPGFNYPGTLWAAAAVVQRGPHTTQQLANLAAVRMLLAFLQAYDMQSHGVKEGGCHQDF